MPRRWVVGMLCALAVAALPKVCRHHLNSEQVAIVNAQANALDEVATNEGDQGIRQWLRAQDAVSSRPWEEFAQHNHAPAMWLWGELQLYKSTDEHSFQAGTQLLIRAADAGYAPAMCSLAKIRLLTGSEFRDLPGGIDLLEAAANQRHIRAMNVLGMCYESGLAVALDEQRALSYYRQTASMGSAVGQFRVGLAHARGQVVAKNDAEAARWFRAAADQNLADAQKALGKSHEHGLGVALDLQQALYWYQLASAQGNAFAKEGIRRLDRTVYQDVSISYVAP